MKLVLMLDGKQYVFENLKRKEKTRKPYVYADILYSIDDFNTFTFRFKYISPRLKYRIEKGDLIRIALNHKWMSSGISGSHSKKYYNFGYNSYTDGRKTSLSYKKRKGNYKCHHVSKASFYGRRIDVVEPQPLVLDKNNLTVNSVIRSKVSIFTGYGYKLRSLKDHTKKGLVSTKYLIFQPTLIEYPSGRILKTYSQKI